jgi:drug/metabolite transporter (DMT)-like permease
MIPILFGLLAGFSFAVSMVLSQKGLHVYPTPWGVWITLLINALFLWACYLLLHPAAPIFIHGNIAFVVIGAFVPGLTRMLAFRGMRNVGSSVTTTVLNSTPMFSATLAIIILGERPGLLVLSGIGLIVGGLMMLSWRGEERTWSRVELLYPLLAAFLFGVKDVVARWGMATTGYPILAAAITATTATPEVFLIIRTIQREKFSLPPPKISLWFVISGLFSGASFLFMFLALHMEQVVIVSPTFNTSSVFVLFLAPLFVRKIEPITARKVAGVLVVIAGVFLISIGRS